MSPHFHVQKIPKLVTYSIFLICGDRGWERIDTCSYWCEISSVSYEMRRPNLCHQTHVRLTLSSSGVPMTHLFYGIFRYISSIKRKLPVTPITNCTPPHKKVKRVLQPTGGPEQLPDDTRDDVRHEDQLLDHTSDLERSTTGDDLTPLPLVPPSPITSPSQYLLSTKAPKQPVEICKVMLTTFF